MIDWSQLRDVFVAWPIITWRERIRGIWLAYALPSSERRLLAIIRKYGLDPADFGH